MKPRPFKVHIAEDRLTDLRRRLNATSWPGDFGNTDWRYGVEEGWLRDMVSYWANDFDWRAQEAKINDFPQFQVEIDGVTIHFIHVRSGRENAIPLLLTHGWPWTFWDWERVVRNLMDAQDGPAFDIIVPSLPGVAFSSPLTTTRINVRAIGRLWTRLMTDVLGYQRFAAAGGDWGALITAELGHAHAERLQAIHLLMVYPPEVDRYPPLEDVYADDEQWMLVRNAEALSLVTSHLAVHRSDPQTLAYALADSPVGTAAWIWERRLSWRDGRSIADEQADRDFMCTTASLYWLTNTIGSSLRIYKEQSPGNAQYMDWPLLHHRRPSIPAPTGVAVAPKEVCLMPRAFVSEHFNLQRWEQVPRGGHFLPYEEPELLADEYRAFFPRHA